jgi:hypothetical protein
LLSTFVTSSPLTTKNGSQCQKSFWRNPLRMSCDQRHLQLEGFHLLSS